MTTAPLFADLLPPAPATAAAPLAEAAEAGIRFLAEPTGVPAAADFAALLQSAGLTAPPLVGADVPAAPREDAGDPLATDGATPAAVDGLLFLSAIQAQVVSNASPLPFGIANLTTEVRNLAAKAVVDNRTASEGKAATAALPAAVSDPASPDTLLLAEPVASALPRDIPEPAVRFDALASAAPDGKRDARDPAGAASRDAPELATLTAAVVTASPASRVFSEASEISFDAPSHATKHSDPVASLSHSQSGGASVPVSLVIEKPVHDPSWHVDAATRIASLVTRGIEHAELRVTPPELGPVELRIEVRGSEATLAIVATQPIARDALEQALPLLRDMLAQQGLSLGQATVGDGRAESQSGSGSSSTHADAFAGSAARDESESSARSPRIGVARGLIDVFA